MLQNESHWKHVAATATEYDERDYAEEPDNDDIVPPGSLIESQPQKLYAPPAWFKKTGSPQQYNDLASLLGDLWQFNEDYAGFGTREAEAYLNATQNNQPLIEGLKDWCVTYFLKRADKSNPKDRNHPARMYGRLLKEYYDILGKLYYYHNSLNRAFLGYVTSYLEWCLGWCLEFGTLAPPALEQIPFIMPGSRPFTSIQKKMADFGVLHDLLGSTLVFVDQTGSADKLRQFSAMNDEAILTRLRQLYEDICQMQPFLCDFDPRETITTLPRTFTIKGESCPSIVAWQWCVKDGIAVILLDVLMGSVEEHLRTGHVRLGVRVTDGGVFCDLQKPWITTKHECRTPDNINLLAVNLYLLELFHEKLFGFYDQIEFDRIRQGAANDASEDVTDEMLALSCQDVAEREDSPAVEVLQHREKAPTHRLRPLRSDVLLRWLAKHFSCEVRGGKGSEITVYREGGKKAIVRGHGQSETVHVITLKNLLKRLGISFQEWLDKVYAAA